MKKTYFITGAMGFVGSHWSEDLLKKGHNVIGMDLHQNYPKLLDYDNFVYIQDSITNLSLLDNIISRSDYICHLASIAEPMQYIKNPKKVIDIAAIAAINIIQKCLFLNKTFFFTSTSEIYGKNPNIPFSEEDDRILGPSSTNRWCYSSSKSLVEHYLYACNLAKEINFITVRLFNVYGPRLNGRVVDNFIKKAIKGEDLIIHNNGEQTRAFTYIDDIIEGFNLLLENKSCLNSSFNIGNTKETSIIDLAKIINNKFGNKLNIVYQGQDEAFGNGYEDIPLRVPNINKINELTSWLPKTSLESGIDKYLKYMNEND